MPEALHVGLLGGFHVSTSDRDVPATAWRLRKAKTLVKLLALEPAHSAHRDQVIDLLWPDLGADAGRNNLNQVVHAARKAFETAGLHGPSGLAVKDDLLVLAPELVVTTDVQALQLEVASAVADGRRDDAAQLLVEAPTELLPEDAYEPWVQVAAVQFQQWRTQVVMQLVESELAGGLPAKAVALLAPILAREPLHEPATRAMMRALATSGRRSEALLLYEKLRNVLRDELAAEPEPATRDVFRELLTAGASSVADIPAQRASGNLPAAITDLIGRARELAETRALLTRVRLLTITGPGGAGKTSLAVELGRRAAPDYAGSVHLVELGAVADGDQVAPRIAAVLQLQVPSEAPALDALVAQLRHRRLLLVLDNCEHLLDACARTATALLRACPALSIVATSREPLHVEGEVSWQTPSLALPDPSSPTTPAELGEVASVELFVQRAAAAVPSFALTASNAAAVAEICYRLDGIPLALELAAACIPTRTPQEIAARLGDALTLLRRGGRNAITRQQTLEATLTWSYDLLDPDEQALLRRLSIFSGSFTIEAAESMCGAEVTDAGVLSSLARLVDTSLLVAEVRAEVTRYRLLETVRQYAAEQLRAAGELQAVADRHCDWYLQFAEERNPDRSLVPLDVTPASLDVEHDNLRAAMRWALTWRPGDALQLATALWRYWLARGFLAEGRTSLEAALAVSPEPSPLRARALIGLAVFDVRRGTDRRLAALGAEAVDIHRSIQGDWEGLGRALHADAVLAYMRGSWDEAWNRSMEAAEIAADAGIAHLAAGVQHLQAMVLMGRGRLPEARAALTAVRDALLRLPADTQPFFPPVLMGFAVEHGGTPSPRLYFEETVLLGRLAGIDEARGYVLCNLADLARLADDLDGALHLLSDAEGTFAEMRDRDGEALVYSRFGCLHRVGGDYGAARSALDHSLMLRRVIGDRRAIGLVTANLGVLAATEGDVAGGRALIEESLFSACEIQDGAAQAGLTFTLASVCADAGDYVGAERHLLGALADSTHIPGNARAMAWGYAELADVLHRLGRADDATTAAKESSRLFAALGAVDAANTSRRRRLQSRG